MAQAAHEEVLTLERAAFEAWRAEEVVALGPWRLRCMRGVTNRANSVWLGLGEPPGGLSRAIADVESFYGARGLPTTFQITPLADSRLDALLAARGYERIDEVSVQVADAALVARSSAREGVSAACGPALTEEWFELSGRRGRFRSADVAVYRALLERAAPRAGFASARCGVGAIGAVGLMILAPPFAGVFSMLTSPDQRRRGLAQAVLCEIARFAVASGASRLYLQVEVANAPARSLYERFGFTEAYRYCYRRRAVP